jgi:hypothetical protein
MWWKEFSTYEMIKIGVIEIQQKFGAVGNLFSRVS